MNRIRIISTLLISATLLFLLFTACDELVTERIENTLTGYPKANFDSDKISGCRPCTVQFYQKADGPRDEYIWTFGDGDSAFVPDPVHVYTGLGSFNVRLLVRDLSSNNEDDEIKLNYITTTDSLIVDFIAQTDSCCLPCSLQFFDNSATCHDLVYLWRFGDGDSSTEMDPVHYYTTEGSFDVKLTVTDTLTGNIDTLTKPGLVYILDTLDAEFTAPVDTCCVPCTVQFSDNSYAPCREPEYVWDFGDGDSSASKDPIHIYDSIGSYSVSLFIRDSITGNQDTETKLNFVYVIDTLDADFTAPVDTCCVPCTLQFSDNSYAPCREPAFIWDFGNGDSSTAKNPLYIYNAIGSFDVSLFINDTVTGNMDTESKLNFIVILDSLPDSAGADFSIAPPTGDTSLTYTFTELTPGDIATWFWDFGDGSSSTATNPSHKYDSAGTFMVRMILTSPCDSVEKVKTLIVTN